MSALIVKQIRLASDVDERIKSFAATHNLSEAEATRRLLDIGLAEAERRYGSLFDEVSKLRSEFGEMAETIGFVLSHTQDRAGESRPLIRLVCEQNLILRMLLIKSDPNKLDEVDRHLDAQLNVFMQSAQAHAEGRSEERTMSPVARA